MASSSESAEPLEIGRHELIEMYRWLLRRCEASRHGSVASARSKLNQFSSNLLPSEVDKAVDIVLAACVAALAGREGWEDKVSYDAICSAIGFDTLVRSQSEADLTFHAVKALAASIQRLYHKHQPRDNEHDEHAVDVWEQILFSPTGITRTKLKRIPNAAALHHIFTGLETDSHQFIVEGRGLPPVETLPTARSILFNAWLPSQSPAARLGICRQFVRHLVTLYESVGGAPAIAHLEAVLFELNKALAEEHFESLSLTQQSHVVKVGRELLFKACRSRDAGEQLPRERDLTHTFLTAMLRPGDNERGKWLSDALAKLTAENEELERRYPSSRASSPHGHRRENALGHARIAPRKAWRYYGTTAPEWEARW